MTNILQWLFENLIKLLLKDEIQLAPVNLLFVFIILLIGYIIIRYGVALIESIFDFLCQKNKRIAKLALFPLILALFLLITHITVSSYKVYTRNQVAEQAHVTTKENSDKQLLYPNKDNIDIIGSSIAVTEKEHKTTLTDLIILDSWLHNIKQSKIKSKDFFDEITNRKHTPFKLHLTKNKATKYVTIDNYQLLINNQPITNVYDIPKNHRDYLINSLHIGTAQETITYHHVKQTKTVRVLYLNLTDISPINSENRDQEILDDFTKKFK